MTSFSFCEDAAAQYRWHIRRLSDVGKKLGGGIDTGSLCGFVNPSRKGGFGGWDLMTDPDPENVARLAGKPRGVCRQCAELFLAIKQLEKQP